VVAGLLGTRLPYGGAVRWPSVLLCVCAVCSPAVVARLQRRPHRRRFRPPGRRSPLASTRRLLYSNVCSMMVGMAEDIFVALRDQYRCSAICGGDGRRCQLQTLTTVRMRPCGVIPPKVSRRGRALPPAQLTRWTEEREWPSRGPMAGRHVASGCAGKRSRCHDGQTDKGQASTKDKHHGHSRR
jgi:hypothetical protein